SAIQRADWASACGWLASDRTSASAVPGRATSVMVTGSTISCVITRGSPSARPSIVAGTEPSTEFSSGTAAASASPDRTAASAAGTLGWGCRRPSEAGTALLSAASAKGEQGCEQGFRAPGQGSAVDAQCMPHLGSASPPAGRAIRAGDTRRAEDSVTPGPAHVTEGDLEAALWRLLTASDREDPTAFRAALDDAEPILGPATEPLWVAWRHVLAARRGLLDGDGEL